MGGSTFEEERGEVWSSLLAAAREPLAHHPDRAAACRHLLGHLIASAIPAGRRLRYDRRRPAPRAGLKGGRTWRPASAPLPRHSP